MACKNEDFSVKKFLFVKKQVSSDHFKNVRFPSVTLYEAYSDRSTVSLKKIE